ncbi:MAG: molecular chaperone DnaJ [Planctomycetia bacterium]|nr:molecular chaperone DnaJ [Planctomycetia bacterium]
MSKTPRDYYEVLGVERTASGEVIAQAYRKLAMKYHPDRNPGDESAVERFKEAAEAFEVLNNPEKRSIYDRHGHAGLNGMPGGGGFQDLGDIFEAFSDIFGGGSFGDIFGGRGGRGRHRPARGSDVRLILELDLIEVARGVKKEVEIRRKVICSTCHGSGARPGTAAETCSYCGGSGQILQQAGFFRMQSTCPNCRGAGKIVRQVCPSCRGQGLSPSISHREIEIPAGIDERTQLRVSGEGDESLNGGEPGDCYITIKIKEHPVFQLDGKNLICHVPITFSQAALGGKIEIPTLSGKQDFQLPAGTQHGDVFRMHAEGLPSMRGDRRGDILVIIQIEVPKTLTPEYEKLLRELAEIENVNVLPQRKGFFARIKDYLHSLCPVETEEDAESRDAQKQKEDKSSS